MLKLFKLNNWIRFLKALKDRLWLDKSTQNFIRFNRIRWKNFHLIGTNKVILVDCFPWNPWIYFYSFIVNILAKKKKASIEYFYFPLSRSKLDKYRIPLRRLNAIYKSFGCQYGMSTLNKKQYEHSAIEFADRTMQELKTKWDLLNLRIKDLPIGDLVYDTYLRNQAKGTVNLTDPALKQILQHAYEIFHTCEDYFKTKEVAAIIPSHNVYIQYGIIVRLASRFGIPSYRINSRQRGLTEFALIKIDEKDHLGVHPYYRFKEFFSKLPPEVQDAKRMKGKKLIESRLSGQIDSGIKYMKYSAYQKTNSKRIFPKTSSKPRILMLLHCFFDSPHRYRSMLFPDFYEWIKYTLETAQKTDFEWFVKPHPNGLPGNEKIIDEFKHKFPNITFLDSTLPNNQIVTEGITSMFTVFGTAGHEFAYMGVPVVNAGDNPHISYNFNLHPKTIEEYKNYIFEADRLPLQIDKREIEEFCYMYYIHYDQVLEESDHPFDEDFIDSSLGNEQNVSCVYDYYINSFSLQREKRLKSYIENFFENDSQLFFSDEQEKKAV